MNDQPTITGVRATLYGDRGRYCAVVHFDGRDMEVVGGFFCDADDENAVYLDKDFSADPCWFETLERAEQSAKQKPIHQLIEDQVRAVVNSHAPVELP